MGRTKKLEQQVREFSEMENQYKEAQAQNYHLYHLREYNNALRSRLIEAKIEPSPANITNIKLLHHTRERVVRC